VPEGASISIRDRHGFERAVPCLPVMVLGRQNQCDVVLSDTMVSRNHLKIEFDDETWWVEDLNSSHGTFFKDERVTRMAWEPGSTIRVADGAYYLTLRQGGAFPSEVNLQAILRTAGLLAGEVELDDLLEQTMDRLLTISRTDRGFIMLPEGPDLVVKVQRNLGANMEKDIHLSMSSVHKVFESGEPVWIHNVATDEALMSQKSVINLQLKTILCLPLLVQGERIGVVYLDSRRIVSEPVDRPTFEAIVALCAIAIERTRLAEANLRNQVLATVGQVASSIVHDFKNGLFVVAGHAQLLGATERDDHAKHHLDQILAAVDRLSRLSADILDYSKVREPKRETVSLDTYLGALLEPLHPRASEAGASLRCEGGPCETSLDRHRFARVVENLVANSIDALEGVEDGTVTLAWRRVQAAVEITVRDNGKGIPKKVLKRIFEPFFSHGKRRGTGLGMATVKKIVEEHGGVVEVQSEEGAGTTATILLPDVPGSLRVESENSTDEFRIPGRA
jgi:signal transduction histidine kinase